MGPDQGAEFVSLPFPPCKIYPEELENGCGAREDICIQKKNVQELCVCCACVCACTYTCKEAYVNKSRGRAVTMILHEIANMTM